jgi:peroxiredoxin
MKNIHPLTTAGIGLAIGSIASLLSGYSLVACGFAFAGYFFTLPEVPKYTSVYQFIMFPIQGFLIGFSLDYGHAVFPATTVLMTLIPLATLPRLVFYNQMVHSKLLWVEPLLMLIVAGIYFSFNIIQHHTWPHWIFPIMPFAFNLYLFKSFVQEGISYRREAKESKMPGPGSEAPDFTLFDHRGEEITLSSYRNKRNVLVFFIRGDWCPACHMMMRSYERNREKFQQKDVLLLAIGPDDFDVNRQMAEKLGLEFRILSDKEQKTAKLYGIHQAAPVTSKLRSNYEEGLPMPASFLVSADGIIRFHSRADRAGELLKPELIFAVLEKLEKN